MPKKAKAPKLWKGDGFLRRRMGGSNPTLAALYGTGPGKVPVHYDAAHTTGTPADVSGLVNRGGAGATYDATHSAAAAKVTVADPWLIVPPGSGVFTLPGGLDLENRHTFVVADVGATLGEQATFRLLGGNATRRQYFEILTRVDGTVRMRFSIWDGAWTNIDAPLTPGPAYDAELFELKFEAGTVTFYAHGQEIGTAAYAPGPLMAETLDRGNNTTSQFHGRLGSFCTLNLGGAGYAAAVDTIRQTFANRMGLTL